MHREYVIDTNISNYRVVKVLPDTGSAPSNFVGDEIAAWIESVKGKRLYLHVYLARDESKKNLGQFLILYQ